MMKKSLTAALAALLLAGTCLFPAQAAAPGQIVSYAAEGEDLILYAAVPDSVTGAACQVGTNSAQNVVVTPIAGEPQPVETVLLVDNSLSVGEEYRPMIYTILSEIAANRMNGEVFTVATFSDHANILLEKSADYTAVKQTLDGITHNDQVTYLTDVLCELLQQFQEEGDASFKRLVIVSDGVDNKSLGYTREELYALLEEHPYPIYTIGCTNGNNNEELENMYALSRMTGGESYHLDDVEDAITVVQGVASLNSAVKVRVVLQKEAMDGTEKGVYLQLTTADGQTYEDSVEMQMPFGAVSQAPETQTPPAEIAPETVPSTEPETAPEPERATVLDRLQELPIGAVIAVAIGAAALVVILVALVVSRKKGAKAPVQEEPRREPAPRMRETKMLHNEAAGPKAGRNTRAIFPTAPKRVVVLQDVQQPLRRFEAELSAPVLVGYDPDCTIRVDYNETVSGRHCLITEENGKLYIANLSRSNGTVVNGKKIADKTELYSGATIELGSVKMRVDLA